MKQQKKVLSLIVVLLGILLMACSDNSVEPGLSEIGNERFAEILAQEDSEGTFVYIGRPTCRYCREFEPILEATLQEIDMFMYYFQTAKARYDQEYGGEARMLSLLSPLEIEGIPIVVYLRDAQVVDYIIGVHQHAEIVAFIERNSSTE